MAPGFLRSGDAPFIVEGLEGRQRLSDRRGSGVIRAGGDLRDAENAERHR